MNHPTADHDFARFYCTSCGTSFDAPVNCGNRFCPVCTTRRRCSVRSKLNHIVASTPSVEGYDIKFLTLTIPNQENLHDGTVLLVRSFRKLRQRQFFRSRVRGGCYVIEICGTPHRWHIHLHAIIHARYIPHRKLSVIWASCSPGKIVFITRIPLKAVVSYVTKYITKSVMPLDQQIIASEELKHLRLFQPFGDWHAFSLAAPKFHYECPSCHATHFIHESVIRHEYRDMPVPSIAFHNT